MNYDVKTRTILEDEILGWILVNDAYLLNVKEILNFHGIDR